MLVIGVCLSATLTIGQFYTVAKVAGNSMQPTLKNHQLILIKKSPIKIKRNDVIALKVPGMANKQYVKRIVALPGDTIWALYGDIYVNGRKVKKNYQNQYTSSFTLLGSSGVAIVPKGKVFVLGDNRQHSTDSRNFGFVSNSQILGKVVIKK